MEELDDALQQVAPQTNQVWSSLGRVKVQAQPVLLRTRLLHSRGGGGGGVWGRIFFKMAMWWLMDDVWK